MLAQRILTALVLVAVVVLAVFKLSANYFSLFIAVIALLGAWEWLNLTDVDKLTSRIMFLVGLILPMLGVTFWTQFLELLGEAMEWPEVKEYSDALDYFVVVPVLFWILAMTLIRQAGPQLLKMEFSPRLKGFIGWMVFLAAWMFLSKLRAFYGAEWVFYFLILIWECSLAYKL